MAVLGVGSISYERNTPEVRETDEAALETECRSLKRGLAAASMASLASCLPGHVTHAARANQTQPHHSTVGVPRSESKVVWRTRVLRAASLAGWKGGESRDLTGKIGVLGGRRALSRTPARPDANRSRTNAQGACAPAHLPPFSGIASCRV